MVQLPKATFITPLCVAHSIYQCQYSEKWVTYTSAVDKYKKEYNTPMQTVYFLDIDDCLIRTSRLTKAHLDAVAKALKVFKVPKVKQIVVEFKTYFFLQYDKHQGKILSPEDEKYMADFLEEVKEVQKPIVEKYGQIKKWSRETFIYLCARKWGVKLGGEVVENTASTLWAKIAQTSTFYPDAKALLIRLLTKKIPFYLITSSDCRLTFEEQSQQFNYDPNYSHNLKMKRFDRLYKLGIKLVNIFTADPLDKPDTDVFKRAYQKAQKDVGVKFHSVMIGDSVTGDLEPAEKIGIEKLVLVKRNKAPLSVKDSIKIVPDLKHLLPHL